MKEREDFLKGFFSRRKDFLNKERIFLRKKIEKKVILNLKYKIEGVFSVLNSGDKKTDDVNESDDFKESEGSK